MLAVHISDVEPLPHQTIAVYDSMLPSLPLRFLLADDAGARKTTIAGILIKETIVQVDVQRRLAVCPGSLAEQLETSYLAGSNYASCESRISGKSAPTMTLPNCCPRPKYRHEAARRTKRDAPHYRRRRASDTLAGGVHSCYNVP